MNFELGTSSESLDLLYVDFFVHIRSLLNKAISSSAHTASNGFLRSRTVNNVGGSGHGLSDVLFR